MLSVIQQMDGRFTLVSRSGWKRPRYHLSYDEALDHPVLSRGEEEAFAQMAYAVRAMLKLDLTPPVSRSGATFAAQRGRRPRLPIAGHERSLPIKAPTAPAAPPTRSRSPAHAASRSP